MGNSERYDQLKFIKQVYRMLDNLTYECSSRLYTMDDDNMSDIFYLRDMAFLIIRECESKNEE